MKEDLIYETYLAFRQDIGDMMYVFTHKIIESKVCRKKFGFFLEKNTQNKNIEEIDSNLTAVNKFFKNITTIKIKGILKIVKDKEIFFVKTFKGSEWERRTESSRNTENFIDTVKLNILEALQRKLLQCKEEKEKRFLEDVNQAKAMFLLNKNFHRDFLNFISNKIFDNNKQPQSSYEKMPNILRQKIFEYCILENYKRIREEFQRKLTK